MIGGLFFVCSYVAPTLILVTQVSDGFVPWAPALIGVGMIPAISAEFVWLIGR